nr:RNA-directed DNA polymerase, eukaryota [Tanacetum cinerariifolium]
PKRSVEDEVVRILTSVFVTNFPEHSGAKELWYTCKQYGQVVDSFIPNRRSKLGKRFGFVRFIKVFDTERLVNNLCTVWIGSHRPHANIARFQRPLGQNMSKNSGNSDEKSKNTVENKGGIFKSNSYVHAVRGSNSGNMNNNDTPTMVLDDECVNQEDYSCCLNGKVKDFEALTNLKNVLGNEGFNNVALRYLGGMWVMLMFKSLEEKEKFKFGVGVGSWFSKIIPTTYEFIVDGRVAWVEIDVDNSEEECYHSKRICILTAAKDNIMETIKITFKGKSFWLRVKEVPGWYPDFDEQGDDESESEFDNDEVEQKVNLVDGDDESLNAEDINEVPETIFEDGKENIMGAEASPDNHEIHSEDPFNIYSLLAKKKGENTLDHSKNESLKFSPGFTPSPKEGVVLNRGNNENHSDRTKDVNSEQWDDNQDGLEDSDAKKKGTKSVGSGCIKKASSIHTRGSLLLVMDELIKETKMESIELFDVKRCWGNFTFDYAHSNSVGYVIDSWKGDVIIMGDFNEVHYKSERFGSNFNVQGANAFNSLIVKAGLEEVPLGGCTFTWCHKSASKMSKLDRFLIFKSLSSSCPNISAITLDRFLSDHRPILLRESSFDYGPTPFQFFHYWLEMDGFEKMVSNTWRESLDVGPNHMINLMNKLKYLKKKIRNVSADIIDKRLGIIKSLQELNSHKSMEIAQKAKIKWAIEGDENSKYFHGILNKQRSRSAIHGVLVSGVWIDNPKLVKHEFLNHFKDRFERPKNIRPTIVMDFPRYLNSSQQTDMKADVTKEEIKKAVWECGSDKSPGPDGFSFGFYKHFWNLIENDVGAAVQHFFQYGAIPKGCNSSFIVLIPKTPDAKMVKDFRPISLIGSLYKIIAKILANQLVTVLGDLVNENLVEAGMFKGVALDSSTIISHMFYTDDAVFVGQWDNSNINTVIYALKCFEKALGLRINMSNSKIMGIVVNDEKVNQVAHRIGCGILNVPFTYLDSKMGGWSMSIYHMSIFKVPLGVLHKMESIRSRFFNGINKDDKKAVWSLEGSGEFTVASVRKLIDDIRLPKVSSQSRWIKAVPIKVNVLSWKVRLDGLPTRINISRRGGSSSHTHETGDVYLTEKELHQLHLDEETLRETLEEQAMDEKTREERIKQKQADDHEFFLEFGVVRYDSDYESD